MQQTDKAHPHVPLSVLYCTCCCPSPREMLHSSTFVLQVGGGYNIHAAVTNVAVVTIKESRQLRMQPFNEYRKRFNLQPYTSFSQFTGKEPTKPF